MVGRPGLMAGAGLVNPGVQIGTLCAPRVLGTDLDIE
jgi:hypothetical protein